MDQSLTAQASTTSYCYDSVDRLIGTTTVNAPSGAAPVAGTSLSLSGTSPTLAYKSSESSNIQWWSGLGARRGGRMFGNADLYLGVLKLEVRILLIVASAVLLIISTLILFGRRFLTRINKEISSKTLGWPNLVMRRTKPSDYLYPAIGGYILAAIFLYWSFRTR